MMIPVYRCWVDGLSFDPMGSLVAEVEVPEGSSVERVWSSGIPPLLMVPDPNDPVIRYAWSAKDIVNDCGNVGSQFRLVSIEDPERNAISINAEDN